MISHAARAARLGTLFAAVVAAIAGSLIATLGFVSWPWAMAFVAAASVGGGLIFGLIGLVSALLYLKPVGWTFLYSFFGAVAACAAAYFLLPYIGDENQDTSGLSTASVTLFLSTLVALIAGAAVGTRLKNA